MPISAEKEVNQFAEALRNEAATYGVDLSEESIVRLGQYYALVEKWNPRLHLVAPCSSGEFATRHVLESLAALRYLKEGETIVDIGSGAGLPLIPCLVVRPSLRGVLIEASAKKAVFLREAIGQVGIEAQIIADRFEKIPTPTADAVTCRALERFAETVPGIIEWAPHTAQFLFFGGTAVEEELRRLDRAYEAVRMPNSEARYLFVIKPNS